MLAYPNYLVKSFVVKVTENPTGQKFGGIFLRYFWNYFRFLDLDGVLYPHIAGLILPPPYSMLFKLFLNLS